MRKEYARLREAYGAVNTELTELKNQPIPEIDNSDQDARVELLNTQYGEAVEENRALSGQVETLSGQVETLTQENTDIKSRLNDLGTAGGDMVELKSSLSTANTNISDLTQKNQTLSSENNRLQGELQTVTSENEELERRYSTLSQDSERLRTEYQTATETNTTLGEENNTLSLQNRDYLAALNSRPAPVTTQTSFVEPRPAPDTRLAGDHQHVLALNAELENKNRLLLKQVSELEGEVGSLKQRPEPKVPVLAAAVPELVTAAPESKFNIMRWLIPFLLIGLTIGLYVFLTEENEGGIASSIASTSTPTRDTQRGQ